MRRALVRSELVSQGLAGRGVDIGNDHLTPIFREAPGAGLADAIGASGDAGGLAGMLNNEADQLDLGDFTDLLSGDSAGLVSGILGKVKDAITGD